jgi:hypothetical protein
MDNIKKSNIETTATPETKAENLKTSYKCSPRLFIPKRCYDIYRKASEGTEFARRFSSLLNSGSSITSRTMGTIIWGILNEHNLNLEDKIVNYNYVMDFCRTVKLHNPIFYESLKKFTIQTANSKEYAEDFFNKVETRWELKNNKQ